MRHAGLILPLLIPNDNAFAFSGHLSILLPFTKTTMRRGCVSVSLLPSSSSSAQSTTVVYGDDGIEEITSAGVPVYETYGNDAASNFEDFTSHKRRKTTSIDNTNSGSADPSVEALNDDSNHRQRCEEKIGQLMAKQASLQQWLTMFVDESRVKRDGIVSKFGRIRSVLDSAEREALVAYDDEVRAVMKRAEIEGEGLEVLSQQLSARLLAFGGVGDVLNDVVDDYGRNHGVE
ncbi:MAG: hypothetical protein ACK56I_24235, partial [bacterium]